MLRSRFIPCLLLRDGGLEKTVSFGDSKYVGDPLNVVRIFNEKEVDELILLDIGATVSGTSPNFSLIERIASECRMPLCYGGGIRTFEQARDIIRLGVEKVCLSSAVLADPALITKIATALGSQSVLVCLDVKRSMFGEFSVVTHNGKKPIRQKFELLLQSLNKSGAGEIIINSVNRDGTMKGYDTKLIQCVKEHISLPITIVGGASSRQEMLATAKAFGPIGLAAGSLFVFHGKYKAVLVNYLSHDEKMAQVAWIDSST